MLTSRLEIDLGAVQRNTRFLRGLIERPAAALAGAPGAAAGPRPALCAVLKQDAYGMGAGRLVKRVAAAGARLVAVYAPAEARSIIEAAVELPVLLLMPVRSLDRFDPVYRYATTGKVHFTLHGLDQLKEVEALAGRLGVALPVHVQLDTGMSRGGCLAPEAARIVEAVLASRRLTLAGLMTHFAAAGSDDAFTEEQARLFDEWLGSLDGRIDRRRVLIHVAATSAALRSAAHHRGMVRIGQGLFGYAPSGTVFQGGTYSSQDDTTASTLEPTLRWTTPVAHETEIPAGWPVGYGSTWRATRPTRIALLPVGYADGYPRSLSNTGHVTFTGLGYDRRGDASGPPPHGPRRRHHAPVVGRVSMDQVTVDVTDVPRELTRPGMEVELISRDPAAPTHLPTLAATAGTVSHDLMCAVGARVHRAYSFAPEMEGDGPIARLGAG